MIQKPEDMYAAAYDSHYKQHDVVSARAGYERVRFQFPESSEAAYAKTQLENLEITAPVLDRKKAAVEEIAAFYSPHNSVIVTTAPSIEGCAVIETIDIISSEVVLGLNLARDLMASVTNVMGGRSTTTQNALRGARREILDELRREAASIGADAVVATSFSYSEFSGAGKSMLFVVAVGTAVKLRTLSSPSENGKAEPLPCGPADLPSSSR